MLLSKALILIGVMLGTAIASSSARSEGHKVLAALIEVASFFALMFGAWLMFGAGL